MGERGETTLITMIALFLAAILMFIVPTMNIADRNDDIAQLEVQTAVTELVDTFRSKGEITLDELDGFIQKISATGNTFDVEIELQILDQNPSKKVTQVETTKIGENIYYTLYTSQILDELRSNPDLRKALKEGDIITVKVKNTNETIAQQIKNFIYSIVGNDTYSIYASHSGVVMSNGSK